VIYNKNDIPTDLQQYFVRAEIGLEPTPGEFIAKLVAVFREVRRVLRDDGTAWVNMGDSYNAHPGQRKTTDAAGEKQQSVRGAQAAPSRSVNGLKGKDLIGIPWMLAFALRQPYYTGRIKDSMDRIWLAAMIDAEGCLFIHKRKAGSDSGAKFTKADGTEMRYARTQDTYGAGLEVANTSLNIVERCKQITGLGSITRQYKDRRQPLYRWHLRGDEARNITREVYPFLVAKQQQARLLTGCPTNGPKAEAAHAALMGLHGGTLTDVDFPAPEAMTQPGFYLRQDVIWSKLNPMPESVRDRCTKAHEYIFLLSKSERYYFDQGAIAEPAQMWFGRSATFDRGGNAVAEHIIPGQSAAQHRPRVNEGARKALRTDTESRHRSSIPGGQSLQSEPDGTRNRRSVWTVATKPYSGAHFATFPPELIEPCILAGAPAGGVVLDPFFGSGTTGEVSQRLGRQWIGCELNTDYKPLQDERLRQPGLVLEEAA
jgi:site-specific DNA-methyltransferase (cytosine-N4-specific)